MIGIMAGILFEKVARSKKTSFYTKDRYSLC
jgi:hypothetical protein